MITKLDIIKAAHAHAHAKTIIVLMEVYFKKSYPRSMEGNIGGPRAQTALEGLTNETHALVKQEIRLAKKALSESGRFM